MGASPRGIGLAVRDAMTRVEYSIDMRSEWEGGSTSSSAWAVRDSCMLGMGMNGGGLPLGGGGTKPLDSMGPRPDQYHDFRAVSRGM